MIEHAARFFALGAALLAADALAQEDRVPMLPEVRAVQRSPLPGIDVPADRYPGNAQQADEDAIERSGAASLPAFMGRRLAGVTATEVEGNPWQAEISYRGQGLSPLLGAPQGLSLYLDGVRMNQPFGDIVNWELIPEAAIAGLSLVPGSNPLYGLNTLAGALVLTTKSGLTHEGTEADVSVGSFGRKRLDFGHGRRWEGGWHGYVAGTLFDDDGWREVSPGRFGNLYLRFGREREGEDWAVSLLHGESRLVGNGLLNESLFTVDPRAVYTSTDTTRARDTLLTLHANRTLARGDRLAFLAWHRRGGRDAQSGDIGELGPAGPAAVLNRSSSDQQETGASLQWTGTRGAHQFALGTEAAAGRIAYDQFASDGRFDASRNAVETPGTEAQQVALRGRSDRFALFAADAIPIRRDTTLTAAARWDGTRVGNDLGHPQPLQSESFRYGKLDPSLALTHDWTPATTLFASVSQGTRVPTALELGCADPAQPCVLPTGLQADPPLKQVVSRTLEAGLRWHRGEALWLSGALFRTDNRDDIVFLRSGVSQAGFFANVERTRRQGLELAAHGRRRALEWNASYAYLDATYQSNGVLPGPLSTADQPNAFHPGTRIAGLPRHVLKLGADWRVRPRVRVGADWQAVGSRVLAGNESGSRPGLGDIAGYGVLNARARWQVDDRWELYLRVDNLLDRRYATAGVANLDYFPGGQPVLPPAQPAPARFLAPGAPRMIAVGARYEWDR